MKAYLKREQGSGAVEFALVLPILLLLAFGIIEFGMLMYTVGQLHNATEAAARCSSVSILCKQGASVNGAVNNATVGNYARTVYKGLAQASFNYDTNGACSYVNATNSGHRVNGNATFKLNVGVYRRNVNVNSAACFP